jgi:glutamyl-tRNA synthetase
MADDQPQVPGSNDELDKLVKQCEAAAEAVTVAKRNGDKPRIDADVKALVALKEQITAIAPDHPLALKDKKKAKSKGSQQAADPNKPLSKNAQKALAKKQAKEARKAKAAAEAEKDKKPEKTVAKRIAPPLPQEPTQKDVVSYGPDRIPLAAMAANALCGGPLTFCCDEQMKGSEPSFMVDGVTVHGSSTAARYAFTTSLSPLETALVDQWTELVNKGSVETALEERLADATYVVGETCTVADCLCWASLQSSDKQHVKRWLRLLEANPAMIKARAIVKQGGDAKKSSGGNCPPLEGAVVGEVVTRFPPEPSGYLHIGHAKAVLLNDYYARRYGGRLLVRFDDTNPSKEKGEYADNILKDLKTLGVDVEADKKDGYVTLSHTSDHFDKIKKEAIKLIKEGKAFMDDTPQEQMKVEREGRQHSKHRDDDVDENLKNFKDMCAGTAPQWCLRAKIDMASDNGTLRDPVIYRANATPHHRTGTKYQAYPTYDLACPIVDSLEGVTHALRTTEYNDRDAQYKWFLSALKLRPVKIHTFGRVNFVRTLMSKRKLAWLVDEKKVENWSDPRFPTIQGVVRRGVSIKALREFILSQGASRNVVNMEWDSFWAINKSAYEPTALRLMAIEQAGCVELEVTNVPQYDDGGIHALITQQHPKDESMGMRPIRVSRKLLLEGEDAATIKDGEEIVLVRWGLFKVTRKGDKLTAEFCEGADRSTFKKKKAIHWLAASPVQVATDIVEGQCGHSQYGDVVPCTLVEYDYLLAKNKLDENDELDTPGVMTPVSKVETAAWADPMLKLISQGDVIQFERRGFYRVDVAFRPPICNNGKTTYPRLVYVPDGKPQHKVPFSRLPSAKK